MNRYIFLISYVACSAHQVDYSILGVDYLSANDKEIYLNKIQNYFGYRYANLIGVSYEWSDYSYRGMDNSKNVSMYIPLVFKNFYLEMGYVKFLNVNLDQESDHLIGLSMQYPSRLNEVAFIKLNYWNSMVNYSYKVCKLTVGKYFPVNDHLSLGLLSNSYLATNLYGIRISLGVGLVYD